MDPRFRERRLRVKYNASERHPSYETLKDFEKELSHAIRDKLPTPIVNGYSRLNDDYRIPSISLELLEQVADAHKNRTIKIFRRPLEKRV